MSAGNDAGTLFDEPSDTEVLARDLRLSVERFVEVFGAGWQPLPQERIDYDADPSGMGELFGPWYMAGEPFQLALRPTDHGVELGVPVGQWAGAHGLHWQVRDRRLVPGIGEELVTEAPPAVAAVLKRRRSGFRYCRYCRRHVGPEERYAHDICFGCATDWLGVVY